MRAVHLPFEILADIVKEVDDVQDLRHLRTASRALCAAATPFAFRALSVIATKASAQNLGRLFDLPDIAAHVREVTFHDTGADRKGRALTYVRTNAIHELASLFSRTHQLPRLETINLTFYPVYKRATYHVVDFESGGRVPLQASILGALASSFSVRAPSQLTSLSLHNLRTSDPPAFETLPLQTIFTTLRCFQLSVLFDRAPDTYTFPVRWCHFWSSLPTQMIPIQTQHALTELTLHSDVCVGSGSEVSLGGLHFPHLCTLSLRNLILDPSTGVEPFILRHATTLARLELISCRLAIASDTFLSLSSSLALARDEGSSSGPGGWHRIWDLFEAELTALITLHVACPQDPRIPLSSFANFLECNAADVAALQRFQSIVAARSEEMSGES